MRDFTQREENSSGIPSELYRDLPAGGELRVWFDGLWHVGDGPSGRAAENTCPACAWRVLAAQRAPCDGCREEVACVGFSGHYLSNDLRMGAAVAAWLREHPGAVWKLRHKDPGWHVSIAGPRIEPLTVETVGRSCANGWASHLNGAVRKFYGCDIETLYPPATL